MRTPRPLSLAPLMLACAQIGIFVVGAAPAPSRITGTATYRERVALTPDAVFEAVLVKASRAGAPSEVIARTRKVSPGQVPIQFEIDYDPRRVEARNRYVVRATIRTGERLRFAGTGAYPLAPGHRGKVTILMHGVSVGLRKQPAPQSGLANTRWRPVLIGGQAVNVPGSEREPWMVLDPRTKGVTGSGGCNRISGSYEAGQDALRFGRIISTMMACSSLKTETAFLRALNDTRRYRVLRRTLELLDGRGRLLARLEERNLR